ncbi:hypothetical protein HQQ80_12125 [Microbacteriaceae bacterium VKM Ac-2855]|nr:hypothetical protein [Microbacteriaceae bacterium VKM Ac-2855]
MQRIHYMGGVADTGDRTCDALFGYGRALANRGVADVVEIPVRERDGSVGTARFLLGPASMLLATQIEGSSTDLSDDATADDLERKTAELVPSTSAWSGIADDQPTGPAFDDFF